MKHHTLLIWSAVIAGAVAPCATMAQNVTGTTALPAVRAEVKADARAAQEQAQSTKGFPQSGEASEPPKPSSDGSVSRAEVNAQTQADMHASQQTNVANDAALGRPHAKKHHTSATTRAEVKAENRDAHATGQDQNSLEGAAQKLPSTK